MPYSNFEYVARCLDYKRLGKQRIEAWQIYKALTEKNHGWKNHPIVKMWKGHEIALLTYGIAMCNEWILRGYKDTMRSRFYMEMRSICDKENETDNFLMPEWIYNIDLQISHRSNLVRKYPEHYKKFFPNVIDNIGYVWK